MKLSRFSFLVLCFSAFGFQPFGSFILLDLVSSISGSSTELLLAMEIKVTPPDMVVSALATIGNLSLVNGQIL